MVSMVNMVSIVNMYLGVWSICLAVTIWEYAQYVFLPHIKNWLRNVNMLDIIRDPVFS